MCTQQDAMLILAQAYEMCQKLYDGKVRDAYLYGSYARGDYHAESDVDIMMVVAEEDKYLRGKRIALSEINDRLSLTHDITVSVKSSPKDRFDRMQDALPFYHNVVKEGIRYVDRGM